MVPNSPNEIEHHPRGASVPEIHGILQSSADFGTNRNATLDLNTQRQTASDSSKSVLGEGFALLMNDGSNRGQTPSSRKLIGESRADHLLEENRGLMNIPPAADKGVDKAYIERQIKRAEPGSLDQRGLQRVLDNFDKSAGADGLLSTEEIDKRKEEIAKQYAVSCVADGKVSEREAANMQEMMYGQLWSNDVAQKYAKDVNSRLLKGTGLKISFDEIQSDGRNNSDIRMNLQADGGRSQPVVDIPVGRSRAVNIKYPGQE